MSDQSNRVNIDIESSSNNMIYYTFNRNSLRYYNKIQNNCHR